MIAAASSVPGELRRHALAAKGFAAAGQLARGADSAFSAWTVEARNASQLPHDRQPKPQAAVLSRVRLVGLAALRSRHLVA